MTYLTQSRVASQFSDCNASAASLILVVINFHLLLFCAVDVIFIRSSLVCNFRGCWSCDRSLFITTGSVVTGLPLNLFPAWMKQDLVAFLAGMSLSLLRICPNRFHLLSKICIDSGFSLHFLYRDLFVIFTGYLMLRTFLSCFLWKMLSFSSSVLVNAQVPQLQSRMDFTNDLQRCNFVALLMVFPFSQMLFSLFKATDERCFLLSTSSLSPMREPTFFVCLQSVSILEIDVYSVLSGFTFKSCF